MLGSSLYINRKGRQRKHEGGGLKEHPAAELDEEIGRRQVGRRVPLRRADECGRRKRRGEHHAHRQRHEELPRLADKQRAVLVNVPRPVDDLGHRTEDGAARPQQPEYGEYAEGPADFDIADKEALGPGKVVG